MEQLDQGVDTTKTAPPVDTSTDRAPRERMSVRDSLRQGFADARREEETPEREVRSREPDDTEVEEPVEETQETPEAEPAEGEAEETVATEAEPKAKAG